jgi:hypothetical protein
LGRELDVLATPGALAIALLGGEGLPSSRILMTHSGIYPTMFQDFSSDFDNDSKDFMRHWGE